jgi:hypothetical protein
MATVAALPTVRDALMGKDVAVQVHLVPEGRAFESRDAIFRRGIHHAMLSVGVHVPCDDVAAWPARGAATIVHELTHIRFHDRDLHLINEEALAYSAQACAWLDASGRMPSTLDVAQRLPPILLELFTTEPPAEFLAVRFRKEPGTSLRGGVLSQLNLGLFAGTSPIESMSDPRGQSVRAYCTCIEENLPDFLAYKPGQIWKESNGTACTLSAPATAPRSGR